MIMQACGVYVVDAENGFYSLYPSFALTDFSKLGETFGQCFQADFSNVGVLNFIVVIFSFLFVDMFDTIGTLIGVSTKAGFLDKEEKLPRVKQALLADAIATSVGAVLGTSTTTTFVESSAGVGAGGRTGLTSVVTGLLFLIAIFFAPVFTAIPGFATAPALIFVGFLMLSIVVKIEFEDFREAVPAYLTILCMPLMYSIAEGIAVGVVSYVVINVVCNLVSNDKKKITPLMYVLAVLFVCKYIFL
jgi:AGZA family xanthine/uracil permease-like MFS transporter